MAGNSNSGKRPGGKDFSPRVRSLVDRALETLQASGDAEKLMLQAFKEDFVGTLQKVQGYAPKWIEGTITTSLEEFVLGAVAAQEANDSISPTTH